MKKVEVAGEQIEFMEEGDLDSLFEKLLQAAGRRGVSEKVINKAKKSVLKQTKKIEKALSKGKLRSSEQVRRLRESTKRLEDIVKDPSSYTGHVIEEILKSL
ncbi:hypothetical protein J7J45_07140 [Candidatus Aerophobetes bacterium]|nr:hypothetical protein [Candidatus Aerophobetes bacterium]